MTDLLSVFYKQDLAWATTPYLSLFYTILPLSILQLLSFIILNSNFSCLGAKPAFFFLVIFLLPFGFFFCNSFSTSNFCIF